MRDYHTGVLCSVILALFDASASSETDEHHKGEEFSTMDFHGVFLSTLRQVKNDVMVIGIWVKPSVLFARETRS